MLVKILGEFENTLDVNVLNVPQALAAIRYSLGADVAEKISTENYYYLLTKSADESDVIALHPQMITSDFNEYDILLIVPDIGGDGAAIVAAVAGAAFAATTAGIVIAAVINIAISLIIGFIIQLLSPTLSFDGDPAMAQANHLDSALFNGAPNIREQGGSVPIVVGQTHAGGVLISAGISSEEKTI